MDAGTGGNIATVCQIDEPVNPATVSTPKRGGGPRGVGHLGGRALPDAFRLAVAPDTGGQDRLVADVDGVIADGLADQVVRDGPALQVVLRQQLVPAGQVAVLAQRAADVEVISPAGELEAVVAPLPGVLADLLQGQVSPLAGEQGEGMGHRWLPFSSWGRASSLTRSRRSARRRRGRAAPGGRPGTTVPDPCPWRWRSQGPGPGA